MSLKWIDGKPTETGPYWIKIKNKAIFTDLVVTIEKEKDWRGRNYLYFNEQGLHIRLRGVVKYCPIPKPID